ncbi:hypothetical protein Bbelb_099870 [Branchiostoma belcheri]|nr:hypothetical protein Bbelb_099870 [Branchiostoma belcheri]
MEVQFKLQVRDFVEWDVQRYHRPQKATVVDLYPSPPTASSRLRAAQYCQLIIPHVILGVLRHGSSPRQPRLGCAERKEVKAKLNVDANQRIDFIWRRAVRVSQTDGELCEQSCAELRDEVFICDRAQSSAGVSRRAVRATSMEELRRAPPWRLLVQPLLVNPRYRSTGLI